MDNAAGAAAAALCVITVFFFFRLRRHRARFHKRVPGPDQIKFIVLYAAARRASMYSYIPACCCRVMCCYTAVAAAAAAYCCSSSSCAGWQKVFLWFTESDSSVLFLFIQTRLFFNVTLGSTVAFSAPIFLPIIHSMHPQYYGHARSRGGR